ncbi:MAG: anion permease [Candidatus Omnitrophica bacterium]|nr:anion permease [Candidatus Omnitrophota bacterium]MBU4488313.1 anion permease [Candidatus Omnitrophota bacterium]MCG2705882.1 anion permease [Candidatus Omnitrophota bacterium]
MVRHYLSKIFILISIVAIVAVTASAIGLDKKQATTLAIFSLSILGALLFWDFRVSFAFFGSSLLLLFRIMTFQEFILFSSMEIILFLIGMMVIVGFLREIGFFAWLLGKFILANMSGRRFFVTLMIGSALFACMLDEVTSIMFVIMLIFEISDYYEVNPVPLIIASVFATNIGSSGTVLGNPIGILIATKASLTFEDFITHAFPLTMLSLALIMFPLMFIFKKSIRELDEKIKESGGNEILAKLLNVPPERKIKIGMVIFGITMAALVFHHRFELLLGLEANTILLITPLISASCIMMWQRDKARSYIEKDVEWWTLLFFLFLFAQSGALTHVGIADFFANKLMAFVGGSRSVLVSIVFFTSGIVSSMLDNVVVVATFIPIVKGLISIDSTYNVLWWALLFGACYGGNMTIIGSTANIIAIGALEKARKGSISFLEWFRVGFFITAITLAIVWIFMLFLPYYK